MKGTLKCIIFGHKFMSRINDGDYILSKQIDFCRHCGLSKEELGFKAEK
jgi:hypothetical protein